MAARHFFAGSALTLVACNGILGLEDEYHLAPATSGSAGTQSGAQNAGSAGRGGNGASGGGASGRGAGTSGTNQTSAGSGNGGSGARAGGSGGEAGESDPGPGGAGQGGTSGGGEAGQSGGESGAGSGGTHGAGRAGSGGRSSAGEGGHAGDTEAGQGGVAGAPPECLALEMGCENETTPKQCVDGNWSPLEPCSGDTPVCLNGNCTACKPEATDCVNDHTFECNDAGEWEAQTQCTGNEPVCRRGRCDFEPPSCLLVEPTCGYWGDESCCAGRDVPGGFFYRTYDGVNGTEQNRPATISRFMLDKFEVTVGRFRTFLGLAGPVTQDNPPAAGVGARPNHENSGWDSAWNVSLAANAATLKSSLNCLDTNNSLGLGTWKDSEGATENQPLNCVTWFEAFAFCAWDGGWLPSEAEWNFAAAGGDDHRIYPWGNATLDSTRAVYWQGVACVPGANDCFATVGSKRDGNGKWGHADLVGNIREWQLDWAVSPQLMPCDDCINLTPGSQRITRGGDRLSTDSLKVVFRYTNSPALRAVNQGFRCARPY